MSGKYYAAIDLGTNNCRLMVCTVENGKSRVVESYSRVTRLGEGLTTSGQLSEAAIARTIDTLKTCAHKISAYPIVGARCIATEACRRAENREEFLDEVYAATGIRLEVIQPQEEAQLALLGCLTLADASLKEAVVIDIGGGSTELIVAEMPTGEAPRIRALLSVPMGVMNILENFALHTYFPDAYRNARETFATHVQAFEALHNLSGVIASGTLPMICTSGTATSIAGVHLNLVRYDRNKVDGLTITMPAIHAVCERIQGLDNNALGKHTCIGTDKADFMVSGCSIMQAVLSVWPAPTVMIADRGIREGIIQSLVCADGPFRKLSFDYRRQYT